MLTPNLEWTLVLKQSRQMAGAFDFQISRDGWSLMEATFTPPPGRKLSEWIQIASAEILEDRFHVKFHDHAREYGSDVPAIEDCRRDCPWTCARERVRELCMNRWGFMIKPPVRTAGCSLFLCDQELVLPTAP